MSEEEINQAIESAYLAALPNPKTIEAQEISPNIFLRTDVYNSNIGSGFKVVCIVFSENGASVFRIKNYGPDTKSETPWPSEGIYASLQNKVPPYQQ